MSRRFQSNRSLRVAIAISLSLFSAGFSQDGFAQAAQQKVHVDIPAQDLSAALTQFGRETGTEIIFEPAAVREKKATAVKGEFERHRALMLLLEGSGLTYRVTAQGAVVIESAGNSADNSRVGSIRLARASASTQSESNPEPSPSTPDATPAAVDVDNEKRSIESIVVTASKRGESTLLDTSMSIQAISGEDMDTRGIKQFVDYARSISGLAFEEQGPGDKRIVLRGLQSTGASTTGIYFDDMVITGANRQDGGGRQPDIRMVDMERIEVLKGPQGTLYGASSMSGTIRMITNKPDPSRTAGAINTSFGATRYANGQNYDFDGMLNVPIIDDKLAVRVVGYSYDQAGFIDDLLLGKNGVNSNDVEGARAALRWLPTENVTVDLMWLWQESSTGGPSWYQPLYGEFVQRNHTAAPWDESLEGANLSLNWKLSHGVVTATVSNMQRDMVYVWPATRVLCVLNVASTEICHAPVHPVQYDYQSSVDQPQDRGVLSSELRYASTWDSPFQVVGGLFYQKEDSTYYSKVIKVDMDGNRLPQLENIVNDYWVKNKTEQTAAFGELTYNLTDRLSATVGARAFKFDIDEVSQNRATMNRPVDAPLAYSASTEDDITWKFNVSYDVQGGHLLYATYSEGFRSGGNNEPDFTTGTVLPPFRSDSVQSYEIGAKGSFFGGDLQLDAAAYYMDWKDMHARVDAEIEGSEFLILGNAGSATIQGIEVGAAAVPFGSVPFSLGGNLTLMQAELSTDDPSGRTGLKGDRIPNVPEVSVNFFADYSFPSFAGSDAIARIDYTFVGKSYSDFRPDSPIFNEQGDNSVVDLRLTFNKDSYRLGLFVSNVLDEHGAQSWISDYNARRPDEVYPLRPRTYGVSLGYQF